MYRRMTMSQSVTFTLPKNQNFKKIWRLIRSGILRCLHVFQGFMCDSASWHVFSFPFLSSPVCCFNHLIRFRLDARSLRISCESCKQYVPWRRVARMKLASMSFVGASESCAPPCTQCNAIPSAKISLIERANNWARKSLHCGAAVRVVRSYRLLQSVTATSCSVTFSVGTLIAWGRS